MFMLHFTAKNLFFFVSSFIGQIPVSSYSIKHILCVPVKGGIHVLMSLLGSDTDGMFGMYLFALLTYGTRLTTGTVSSDLMAIGRCSSIWISP